MPSPSAAAISCDERVGVHHGAGRIGRACDQHALERLACDARRSAPRPSAPSASRPRFRSAPARSRARVEDVPVRRIAGIGERDPVARLEQRQKRQDETAGRAGGDHDPRRIEREPVSARRSGARCARAATECRASRCSRCGRASSAACAAAIAVAGAGAAGWPTSMWTTRPPAASIRAAAAITSMTMKGGTSLRREGVSRRFGRVKHEFPDPAAATRPAVAVFRGLLALALRS